MWTKSSIYQDANIKNGDSIKVLMQSTLPTACLTNAFVASRSVSVNILKPVGFAPPTVSLLSVRGNNICQGSADSFRVYPSNVSADETVSYQWVKNGNQVGKGGYYY